MVRQELVTICTERNSTMSPEVENMLRKCVGQEIVLYGTICEKYRVLQKPLAARQVKPLLSSDT